MKKPLCLLFLLVTITGNLPAQERPNFVWLISEDNSKHFLQLFDKTGAETPNIKKLSENGLVFTHAFSNSPVCSVARTTLITSCYAPRIGTQYHRRSKMVPLPVGLKAFPEYLKRAGYYTTNKAKTDYNVKVGKNVWNESSRKASWRNRKTGQPFFHKQSFKSTHESSLHFNKNTMQNQRTTTDPTQVFVAPIHPSTKIFQYTYARYHDRIRLMDQQVGQVLKQLQADGLMDSTFVFYFSDHGGVLPRGKGYAYETGLHIPLVVHVPKKFKHLVDAKPGTRVKGFVSFVDFGPTLLSLAGIEVPKQVDGKPFLGPKVKTDGVNERDTAFGYADRFDEKYDFVRTVRQGQYKYIRNYQPFNFDGLQNNYRYRMLAYQQWREHYKSGKLNPTQSQFFRPRAAEQLFDLATDPYETKNLANDPSMQKTLVSLRKKLAQHVKTTADLSFFPESFLYESGFDQPTRFGIKHQKQIAQLVDIADLSLLKFDDAKQKIEAALKSENRWCRYWGLIACSSHGKAAKEFFELAKTIGAKDQDALVRTRAAEFLAIAGQVDPAPVLQQAIYEAKSGIEATLISNSIVLLKDGYGFQFALDPQKFAPAIRNDWFFKRRLEYLAPKK